MVGHKDGQLTYNISAVSMRMELRIIYDEIMLLYNVNKIKYNLPAFFLEARN